MKFSKNRLHELILEELAKSESEEPLYEGLSEQDIYSLYYDIRDGALKFQDFKVYIQKLLNLKTGDNSHMFDPVSFAQASEE